MKKALLVGINKYPDPDNDLRGCINDINDMASFLVNERGFKMADIRLLTDKRATKINILERLNWLVKDAKKGDQLLFHYSGHGAQMASRAKSGEIDKLDEVICPYNFEWTDETALKDKEFAQVFKSIPEGVDFIWVSDSCHSADLSKGIKKRGVFKYRNFKTPDDIAWRNKSVIRSKVDLIPIDKSSKKSNIALISGCKSEQESADAVFNDRNNGALTYFLFKTLNEDKQKKLSLVKLVAEINKRLKPDYEQDPQLEGSKILMNKTFF